MAKDISLRVRVTKSIADRFEAAVKTEAATLNFGEEISMSSVMRKAIGEYIAKWESIAASDVAQQAARTLKKGAALRASSSVRK